MTWHYAAGGERHGPVDDTELDRLIAAGAVTGDTLVWHAGLDGWRPLREARPAALLADAARRRAAMPVAQPARPRPDADAEFARVAGRRLAPVSAVQRGMALVFAQPGPTIGISALIMVLMMASGFVPCVGSLVQIAVMGPLVAAWYGYFLKHIRGQPAALEDVFAIFSSPDLVQLIVAYVVVAVAGLLVMVPIPFFIFFGAFWTAAQRDVPGVVVVPLLVIALLPFLAAWMYVNTAFMFALPLIHDRGHAFWPALRLSQRVVHQQLPATLGLVLLCWLIGVAGLLALCLGIFVAAPIAVSSFAYAYEDLFGERDPA
jgi:hypothetical protein